jgi:hypothetical protein
VSHTLSGVAGATTFREERIHSEISRNPTPAMWRRQWQPADRGRRCGQQSRKTALRPARRRLALSGKGRVHRATKPRSQSCHFFYTPDSSLAEESLESFEANRIWSPGTRLGSLVLHDQETIRYRQELSQELVLVLNEVKGVRHKNPVHGGKGEARAPEIPQNLTDCDSLIFVGNSPQRLLVKIDGLNAAAGS